MEAAGINIGYLLLQCGVLSAVFLLPTCLVALSVIPRTDLDGPVKALWIIMALLLPVLGALCYLIFGRKQA